MRSHPLALLVLTFALGSGPVAPAQPPAPSPANPAPPPASGIGLVDFDALQRPARPIRVLDPRPRADYDAGHVPQAVWVDVKKAQELAARPGGLEDVDAWTEWARPLGLTPDLAVVVVDGARQLEAARVWWLLRYLGVERVGLVDGNMPLWIVQRRPTEQAAPEVPPTTISVAFRRDRLATRDDVLNTLKSQDARIVDARTIEEWAGQKVLSKRGGHMPNACRVEWTEFVDKDGRFLPRDQIEAKVAAAGIKAGEPVIAHCQGGGRASVDAFVFEMLGHPTRNYYLSWADWGNADDTPIEGGPAKAEAAPAPNTVPPVPAPPDPARPDNGAPKPTNPGEAVNLDFKPGYKAPVFIAPAEPAASDDRPIETRPFTVEYDYKAKWGHADEFLALFRKNHLPILREREKQGDILSISVVKPRIHTGEADRWDFRVTLVFKSPAQAFNIAADEPIKARLFPDQDAYRAEERRRFEILEGHTDLPIETVPLD